MFVVEEGIICSSSIETSLSNNVVFSSLSLLQSVYAVTCPKGTSRTGYGTCKPCENGHFADTVNSTKCFKCHHCRRQEIETKPCTPTHNIICTCAPGYYFNSEILFCFKCRSCGPGRGVIKNCTFNSDTVCAPCEKVRKDVQIEGSANRFVF